MRYVSRTCKSRFNSAWNFPRERSKRCSQISSSTPRPNSSSWATLSARWLEMWDSSDLNNSVLISSWRTFFLVSNWVVRLSDFIDWQYIVYYWVLNAVFIAYFDREGSMKDYFSTINRWPKFKFLNISVRVLRDDRRWRGHPQRRYYHRQWQSSGKPQTSYDYENAWHGFIYTFIL